MPKPRINRFSWMVLICLSVIALLAVLSGYTLPPQRDEGAGAHVFQISIVLLLPVGLLFSDYCGLGPPCAERALIGSPSGPVSPCVWGAVLP